MRNQRAQNTDDKRKTSSPFRVHTSTTVLAGIASDEQRRARLGNDFTTTGRRDVRGTRRTARGRLLVGAMLACVFGGLAFAGGAAAARTAAKVPDDNTPYGLHAYGTVNDLGPTAGAHFSKPLVGMASTPTGKGYFLAASDGGVFAYGDAAFQGSTGNVALAGPVVGIAATPTGDGYWLVARDGGVFSFGDARFHGSAAGVSTAEIVAIGTTPTGKGYWLAAKDGGIFSFGDAKFFGSAAPLNVTSPIVSMATTRAGNGYTLLAADGGVFAFGDAIFHGSAYATIPNDAVGITSVNDGYAIARKTGSVIVYDDKLPSIGDLPDANRAATIGLASNGNGYWTLQGGPLVDHFDAFLTCTRQHESSPNGPGYDDGYGAVNPAHRYFGAYQFGPSTWSNTARHAGRLDLVGVNPAQACVEDQDALAWDLFNWQGYQPWENRCLGLR